VYQEMSAENQNQKSDQQRARVARVEVKSAPVVDVSVPEAVVVRSPKFLEPGWYLETWERMTQVVHVVSGPAGGLLKRYLTTGMVTEPGQLAGAEWMKLGERVSLTREAGSHPPVGKCAFRWGRFCGVGVVQMMTLPGRAVEEKCVALASGVTVPLEQLVQGQAVWFPIEKG
jgi:hypothetical protein